jgi:hypothetical protein
MASRRAALAPRSTGVEAVEDASASGSLQVGQRLANPGLPGLSSNSSEQTTQTLMGKAITAFKINTDWGIHRAERLQRGLEIHID